jgi:ABC-type ATPase with predicted acetyltransferase domain
MRRIDITGERYGRLVALEYSYSTKDGKAVWKCQCDCGSIYYAKAKDMRSGNTKSCGCYALEVRRKSNSVKGNIV